MDCIIISEDDEWAQPLEAKLSQACLKIARHDNKSYTTTEETLYLVDSLGRQPDIADCGKRIIIFTDEPNDHNSLQLPRTQAARWLLNHLGLSSTGLPLVWGSSSTEGQLILDKDGLIQSTNDTLALCLSARAEQYHNQPISQIFPKLNDKPNYSIQRQLHKLCQQNKPCRGKILAAKTLQGRNRHLEVCANKLIGERFLLSCRDVTQRISSHNAMKQKARFDALTGLANRQLLMDRLRMALARSKRFQRKLAIMYIDLDHFKPINDTWGHAAGDAVLCEASQRMKNTVREIDTVARLGGDEFIIIIEDLKDHSDAGVIAKNLLAELGKVFYWQSHEFQVGCSIGISISSDDKEDANVLIEKADLALYRAKNKGRQRFEFCTPELTAQSRYKLVLQDGLQQAFNENQLQLYFQPIASTIDNHIEGAEVLLRWLHPKVGKVPPKDFIPLLEQTGLIVPVGEWLIGKACQQWSSWKQQGLLDSAAKISINISTCQFGSPHLVKHLQTVLSTFDMPAHTLALEISEDLLSDEHSRLASTFKQLNQAGINLVIDDFGLGNTSVHSLSAFNLDGIKLEKPLLASLSSEKGTNSLSAFSALAHSLDIHIIAEGVDDINQVPTLARSGIDSYQGYSLCPPMNGFDFEQFLEQNKIIQNNSKIFA